VRERARASTAAGIDRQLGVVKRFELGEEAKGLFSSYNFVKFFKIFHHIESLDACMKH
jgi:hypothetical protein